jgi:hypothetical protein
MKTDRSAHDIARDIMSLLCKGPDAAAELDNLIGRAYQSADVLSDVRLITYLRSSFTARYRLENWWQLRDKALELLTARHGSEHATRLMMGLLEPKCVKTDTTLPTLFPAWR